MEKKLDMTMLNIEDTLDFDYSVGEVYIDSMETFQKELLDPFKDPARHIYYRGERVSQLSRPLLPTMYRDKETLLKGNAYHTEVDADYLLNYYKSYGGYVDLYNAVFGNAGKYRLYDLCAFSQHYLNNSPLIDFTKSLYVALSFGLKEKTEFADDGVIYAVEIEDLNNNYTTDKVVAECWLNDYHVSVYDFSRSEDSPEMRKAKAEAQRTSPTAKLIDIATNDLMKFQQGVFLLLSDFSLVNRLYLTKNVRDSVNIKKYILSKDICAELVAMVANDRPWYRFSQLLDIPEGLRSAMALNKVQL